MFQSVSTPCHSYSQAGTSRTYIQFVINTLRYLSTFALEKTSSIFLLKMYKFHPQSIFLLASHLFQIASQLAYLPVFEQPFQHLHRKSCHEFYMIFFQMIPVVPREAAAEVSRRGKTIGKIGCCESRM